MSLIDSAFSLIKFNLDKATHTEWEYLCQYLQDDLVIACKEQQDQLLCWYHDFAHFSYLEDIVSQNDLCEVIIKDQLYYKTTSIDYTPFKWSLSPEHLQGHLDLLCLNHKISWNYSTPFASFYAKLFQQSFRVTLIHHSLSSTESSQVFFRKITSQPLELSSFKMNHQSQEIIHQLIEQQSNLLVCGATGSGKSALLSSITQLISQQEHTVVLEDTQEIIPPSNASQLIASDQPKHRLIDYCHYALRMSPDRIIIGEIRSDEVIPYLLMMNTGHRGVFSTIHANSAVDAIHRCAFLFSLYSKQEISYNTILKLVTQSVDHIIFMKDRGVDQIIKVLGSEENNCFYETIYSNSARDLLIRDSFRNECINP